MTLPQAVGQVLRFFDRLFGIPIDYARTVDGWADLVHPEERRAMSDYFSREVLGEKKPFDREYRIVRYGDKQVRWVHGLGRLQCDEDGKPVSMLGTIQDVTERKEAEQALRSSEAKYRRLHESMTDAFASVDMDGHITEHNEAFRKMLGYEAEELLALRYTDVTPEKWHPLEAEIIQKQVVPRGYSDIYEKEYRRKDGSIFPVELRTFLIKDDHGQSCAMWAIVRDITERKRAKEALQTARDELERQVEQRTTELVKANEDLTLFRKFAESSGEGVGMSDFEGRIAYVNPMLGRMFGEEKPEDVIGKNVAEYYPQEYFQRRNDEMIPALLREGYWRAEQTLLPRRGKSLLTLQSTFLIRDEKGNPLRIAVVISDITDRKRAEEALAKQHCTLKHLLHSSDHERQLIAYEIHDGLAQKLAGAIMQFQAFDHLRDKTPNLAAKAYDAGITMLQQGLSEARRLIADVRHPILDEAGVVEAIAHLIHEQSREKGPKIEYFSKVDFDRLAITLENAIYRICQEALTNACQHSKSERVRVSLLQRGDHVRIEIRDWGIGFDVKAVPKNRFGLEGIRQRAKLLGGKYSLRSSLGKGTRITVELPVVARE